MIRVGTYACQSCGKENYDYFQTIRNYLRDNGPAPPAVLASDLRLPLKVINKFREEEGM